MGKVGNYIVGASVVAAMAGNPTAANAQENVVTDIGGNKVEYVQDNVREELKNDSAIAWETVARVTQQLNDSSENSSREDTAQEMREDAQKNTAYINRFNAVEEQSNLSMDECAANAVFECMAQQTTHKMRISQRYGATEEEYEKMQAEGKNYVYGDFLEYLATSGDKKLGKALGIPEEEMTPENITMALAYGPKIPYEKQEQLYNEAQQDGRLKAYNENVRSIGGDIERWSNLSMTEASLEGSANYGLGIEKIRELSDSISQRYGENANALLVKAFTGDKELAEKMGFKDEKPDAQQLVYMLACAEPLSKEDQNKLVTEQDRVVADKVLDHMVNKDSKTDYFTLNYNEQKSENSVQSVVDMISSQQSADKTNDLGNKLKDDLSKIHPKTEKVNNDNMMMISMAKMQQNGGH